MNLSRAAFHFLFAISFACIATASSLDDSTWSKASNGQSSIREIAPNLVVDVPLRRVEGARLVLFNRPLAKMLGFKLGTPREVEKLVLHHFAKMVSTRPTDSPGGFATKYFDGLFRNQDDYLSWYRDRRPRGDGRAVWVGEISYQLPENSKKVFDFDIVLKGVGRTPLARDQIGHSVPSVVKSRYQYEDGLQTMDEAVRSFVISQTLHEQGIGTTWDLAVIELPRKKLNPLTGKWENAALTVRIGSQIRPANFIALTDHPTDFHNLFELSVRRLFGIARHESLTESDLNDYWLALFHEFAHCAGSFCTYNYHHGSVNLSNMTSTGNAIDFGTFVTPDVVQMEFLDSRQKKQTDEINSFLSVLLYYAHLVQETEPSMRITPQQIQIFFSHNYVITRIRLALMRLGLSFEQTKDLLDETKIINSNAHLITKSIAKFLVYTSETLAPRTVYYGKQELNPMAFDTNQILRGAAHVMRLPLEQQDQAWIDLFVPKANWSATRPEDLQPGGVHHSFFVEFKMFMKKFVNYAEAKGVNLTTLEQGALTTKPAQSYAAAASRITVLVDNVRKKHRSFIANSKDALEIINAMIQQRPSSTSNDCANTLNRAQ